MGCIDCADCISIVLTAFGLCTCVDHKDFSKEQTRLISFNIDPRSTNIARIANAVQVTL